MNLWFRMIGVIVSMLWKPRLTPPLERSVLRFRVWPNDLDLNLHMNNGRYMTIMDLGRIDIIMRTGLWRSLRRHGWIPILSAGVTRYRRELRLFEPFELETRIRYWNQTAFVIEHRIRFLKGEKAGSIAASSLVKGGIYDRAERRFVHFDRLLEELAKDVTASTAQSPAATPEIEALLATVDALAMVDRAAEDQKPEQQDP